MPIDFAGTWHVPDTVLELSNSEKLPVVWWSVLVNFLVLGHL